MHLAEVIALRSVPAAGLIIELTRRCPLSCTHCSTNSSMQSEEHSGQAALRLVGSFTGDDHPEVLALTGGEPLLRPALVEQLADRAHEVGTRVHVLTGMFFARGPRVPAPIRRAIRSVDHVSASLDRYHEREVSRTAIFRVFEELLSEGRSVSFQIVGVDDDDPYVAGLVASVRARFGDRVPMLISGLRAEGRAKRWLDPATGSGRPSAAEPAPCTMAAWPVLTADGTITACCNQTVVDGSGPAHLRLGRADMDSWPSLSAACRDRRLLQAVRAFGPRFAAELAGRPCDGYCDTCFGLGEDDAVAGELARMNLRLIEACSVAARRGAGAVRFAEQYGLRRYAPLVALGAEDEACLAG